MEKQKRRGAPKKPHKKVKLSTTITEWIAELLEELRRPGESKGDVIARALAALQA